MYKKSRVKKPQDTVGFSSIWEAVKSGNVDRVKMHLSGRSAINLNGVQNGYTPIFIAAQYNKPAMIRLLAKENVNPNIPCQGMSPLAAAAASGYTECVRELLEMRANPNAPDLPLHQAAKYGYATVVEVLLQYGASLDKKDSAGFTPLLAALINKHEKAAEVILQKAVQQGSATINDKTFDHPRTALHYAAEFEGGLRLVDLLLTPSLGVDVNATDWLGLTPLHLALAFEHGTEVAKRLLKDPAIDVSIADRKHRLPLHLACSKGKHEVISTLVDLAPHLINSRDVHGMSPLHRAVLQGHDNIALHLIKRNADVKSLDRRSKTPLQMVSSQQTERKQLLEVCYQSFQEGLVNTLNDEKLSDIAIHLENGTRVILCSKVVLFARSEYWRKVLLEKEKEARSNADNGGGDNGDRLEIVVNEGRYDVFHAMLCYLYTDNIQFPQLASLTGDDAGQELKPAEAARRVQQNTNFLADVLIMAERYGEKRLHELCSQAIDADTLRSLERRRKRVDAARRLLISHFSSDMKKMINNKRFSDVIFSVEGKIVYCHKVILCARNEFFKAMLMGPWAKEKCTEEDPIPISDTSYRIFYSVVEFCYTGDCPRIEPDTVVDLYQASHQYMLLELRKRCENIIEEAVGVDNAVPIYELGHIYEDDKMQEKALAFITQDAETFQLISANSAFAGLPEHLLVSIYCRLLVQIGGFTATSTSELLISQHNRKGDTPLLLACSIPGMVVAVKWLLQNGANPNEAGKNGCPLHIATRAGDIGTVRALLDHPGLLVNAADPTTGETALHIACSAAHENIALLLIERNGDVNAQDKRGRTPLEVIPETNFTFATNFKEHRELSKIKFDKAFNQPSFSDVIIAGGDAQYYCHQAVLCARCPAFEQAIEDASRFEEIKLNSGEVRKVPVVDVEGVQEQTIEAFLRFMYTDEIQVDPDNVYEMMGLSMAYPVSRLLALCELANDPTAAATEASTMAIDFVPLFDREKFADIRFLFDPPPSSDSGGGGGGEGGDEEEDDEEWRRHLPDCSFASTDRQDNSEEDREEEKGKEAKEDVVVIHAHRAIIATRCPLLLTHFPELTTEKRSVKAGENPAIEVDMRQWTAAPQARKGAKNETGDGCRNRYASFFALLRFLYSGVMSLPSASASASASAFEAEVGQQVDGARAKDDEAALYREILSLAEMLNLKALVRQVQPKVDEEERRVKKAYLLTSAF